MENELYKKVYHMVMKLYRKTNLKRIKFTDADIVLIYLWSVLHDRPTCWACNKKSWPIYYRRKQFPDPSTVCRRLRTEGVQALLKSVEKKLHTTTEPSICRWIDAKGLPINNCSTDKQAGYGYTGGGKGKGYKLYAIADLKQGFVNWKICPMQYRESRVAINLIEESIFQGYLVGDRAYDSNTLYELANTKSIKLIAPRFYKHAKSLQRSKHSPFRLEMLERLKSKFIQNMINYRVEIEHMFGQISSLCFGLKPLPSWVRGLFRVENWVRGKIIFYNIWKQQLSLQDI